MRGGLSERINRPHHNSVIAGVQFRRDAYTIGSQLEGTATVKGHQVFRRLAGAGRIPTEILPRRCGAVVGNQGDTYTHRRQGNDTHNDPATARRRPHVYRPRRLKVRRYIAFVIASSIINGSRQKEQFK